MADFGLLVGFFLIVMADSGVPMGFFLTIVMADFGMPMGDFLIMPSTARFEPWTVTCMVSAQNNIAGVRGLATGTAGALLRSRGAAPETTMWTDGQWR